MPKFQNTQKQKNKILREVAKKAHENYEARVQKKEKAEMESLLENDLKNQT